MRRTLQKIMVMSVGFLVVIILLFQLVDSLAGPAEATFRDAPRIFCEQTRFIGITLPPFGIYLCPEAEGNESTRAHELVHWDQYESRGFLMFYVSYGLGYMKSGFVYEDHPMEVDARQRTADFMRNESSLPTRIR